MKTSMKPIVYGLIGYVVTLFVVYAISESILDINYDVRDIASIVLSLPGYLVMYYKKKDGLTLEEAFISTNNFFRKYKYILLFLLIVVFYVRLTTLAEMLSGKSYC